MNNRVAIWKMPKTEDDDDLATKQEEANEKKRIAVAKKEALVKAYWEKIAKEQKETEVVNKNHNALSKSHAEVMQALDSFQTSLQSAVYRFNTYPTTVSHTYYTPATYYQAYTPTTYYQATTYAYGGARRGDYKLPSTRYNYVNTYTYTPSSYKNYYYGYGY